MSENINNNEISITNFQKKLVNIESTNFSSRKGVNSIFHAYNTDKETNPNQIEKLEKHELENLVYDLKEIDGNGGKKDDKIDMQEAEAFVRNFNKKHPDAKITTNDLFGFVERVSNRFEYYNKDDLGDINSIIAVGEPLSKQVFNLHVYNPKTKAMEVMKLSIKLYATNDKNKPHQYIWHIIEGKDLSTTIAAEYGYKGENAFLEFLQHALGKPDPQTYEASFNPQYASTKPEPNGKGIRKVATSEVDNINPTEIIVPHGFDVDPRILRDQYENPKTQETINEFCTYLENAIEYSKKQLEEYSKGYGFTEKAAEAISSILNNKYIQTTGNTEALVKNSIAKAEVILKKMKSADNSLDGILNHNDFGTYYKHLTGDKPFDPNKTKIFLEFRKEYLEKQAAITTYKYIHDCLDETIQDFNAAYKQKHNKSRTILASKARVACKELREERYQKLYNKLYEMLHNYLGVERKNWDTMFKELEKRNIDPTEYLESISKTIMKSVDEKTKKVLNIKDLDTIDKVDTDLKDKYSSISYDALGKNGNIISKVEQYNNSQIIGGIAIYAGSQLFLYACGFGLLSKIPKLASGFVSGSSYALSYLSVESTQRLTNGIDNDEDFFNSEAFQELAITAGIEFAAGYLFDGMLKKEYFGKYEKKGIDAEKRVLEKENAILEQSDNVAQLAEADLVGQSFLKNAGKVFTKDEITKLIAARGIAGAVGGAKDGSKELFKEVFKDKYNWKDLLSATIIGGVSNALFIRFKLSPFAKENHKIIGKFFEKSPKGTVKREQRDYITKDTTEEEYVNEIELNDFEKFIQKLKQETIIEIKKEALKNKIDPQEIDKTLQEHPDALEDIILSYYLCGYMLPNAKY